MSNSNGSHWSRAVGLVTRTLPFIGINAVVYGGFFFAGLIWFSFWGGLAFIAGKAGLGPVSAVLFFIGFGAGAGLVRFARRYILYMVKGAHIAAMTEILKGGQIPGGMNQLSYGQKIIQNYFKDVSVLFALDQLVTGSLKSLQRKVLRFASWLPLPEAAESLVRMVTEVVERSLTYVDEAILSYAIYQGDSNIWNSARHGVILYAQSFKPILTTAAKVWLLGKVMVFLLFLLFLVPAIGVMLLAQGHIGVQIVALLMTLVAAWGAKATFFEPFALAYTLVTYHESIAGQVPDYEWDQRLSAVSSKYKELVQRATNPTAPVAS